MLIKEMNCLLCGGGSGSGEKLRFFTTTVTVSPEEIVISQEGLHLPRFRRLSLRFRGCTSPDIFSSEGTKSMPIRWRAFVFPFRADRAKREILFDEQHVTKSEYRSRRRKIIYKACGVARWGEKGDS